MKYYYVYCYCFECLNMDPNDKINNECYCYKNDKYIDQYSHACKDNFSFNKAIRRVKNKYLIDIINETLFIEDETLKNKLIWFRDNVLKLDKEYLDIIYEYNLSNPAIIYNLSNDPLKKEKCMYILKNYINPIIYFIDNKKYTDVLKVYNHLLEYFKNIYSLDIPTKIKTKK